ncbi:MAG: hypothetical protein ABW185_10315 [Sedimenticola sp.]
MAAGLPTSSSSGHIQTLEPAQLHHQTTPDSDPAPGKIPVVHGQVRSLAHSHMPVSRTPETFADPVLHAGGWDHHPGWTLVYRSAIAVRSALRR